MPAAQYEGELTAPAVGAAGPSPPTAAPRRIASTNNSDDREGSISPPYRRASGDSNNRVTPTGEPPLPYDDAAPALPDEAATEDDGWEAHWDYLAQAYYFFNRFSQISQWENPRVPSANASRDGSNDRFLHSAAPGVTNSSDVPGTSSPPKPKRVAGGYNPAIHGDYDPNADYAIEARKQEEEEIAAIAASAAAWRAGLTVARQDYGATAQFNRFTGRFQNDSINPDNHNDEAKSRRQMSAFFDVDAAANTHDGRSLKAERRNKPLTKKELKAFKEKRRERKEEKRRAWLRD